MLGPRLEYPLPQPWPPGVILPRPLCEEMKALVLVLVLDGLSVGTPISCWCSRINMSQTWSYV